jgi:hypothetical protein
MPAARMASGGLLITAASLERPKRVHSDDCYSAMSDDQLVTTASLQRQTAY